MNITDVIQDRRSIRRFTDRPVSRDEIEALLAAAVAAPNHKLTEPWRFYVLGPEARHAFGLALGARKAKKIENPEQARAMMDRVAEEHRELPAMIACATVHNENAELAEEDYAAVMMGIQNLALLAVAKGLGTHIKTGAVMSDPAARAAMGVADNERVIALVNLGTPAEVPAARARGAATTRTTWVP